MIGGEADERQTITSFSALCVGACGMHQKVTGGGDDDCYTDDHASNDGGGDHGCVCHGGGSDGGVCPSKRGSVRTDLSSHAAQVL